MLFLEMLYYKTNKVTICSNLQIFHKTVYANIILIAMVSQVINVLSFTYKIFGKEWIECLKD